MTESEREVVSKIQRKYAILSTIFIQYANYTQVRGFFLFYKIKKLLTNSRSGNIIRYEQRAKPVLERRLA